MSQERPLWSLASVSVPALKQERYGRLTRWMQVEELDALVVFGLAARGRKCHLRYLTNYSPVSRYGAVVFTYQGEHVLFVPFAVHIAWACDMTWIEDVRLTTDPAKDIAAVLRQRGCTTGQVGLVEDEILPGFRVALAAHLPQAQFSAVEAALMRLRMVKGSLEVCLARHSASLADQVFAEAASLIASGATEAEIFAAGEACLRRLNAEESLLLIDSLGDQIRPLPLPRAVEPGDLVQYSVEPVSPGGHWIQSVRMFSRGEPAPLAARVVQGSVEALAVAQERLRPGVPLRDVADAMAEVLQPLAPQGRAPYGHGAGMDLFEPPVLDVENAMSVEEGMVIVIHPNLIVDGRGFYVGDTYLVTANGTERLSAYPLELAVV